MEAKHRAKTNYLPAEPPTVRRMTAEETRALEGLTSPLSQPPIDRVFTPGQTQQEETTPWERSLALLLRMAPFSLIWLLLAIGIVWKFQTAADTGFLVFALLTALTYYKMSAQEYQHSSSGVERHRIDSAVTLATQRMAHDQELKRMALESTLKLLEGRSHERY